MGSLRSYEQRLLQRVEKSIESAFQSKLTIDPKNVENKASSQNRGESSRGGRFGRGRGRGKNSHGRGGRGNFDGRRNDGRVNKWCGICQKNSHDEKVCWNKGNP